MKFVEVVPGEAGEVNVLARKIWPLVYSHMISQGQIDYMLDWMYAPETIRKEIEEENIVYLLIEAQESRVGFVSFGPLLSGAPCCIHKIYVAPEFHRRGIGRQALKEISRRAINADSSCLELRVNRGNERAINFYESCGFQIIREDCADIGGGFVMDDYIFRKPLLKMH